jgi:hypothetical protein
MVLMLTCGRVAHVCSCGDENDGRPPPQDDEGMTRMRCNQTSVMLVSSATRDDEIQVKTSVMLVSSRCWVRDAVVSTTMMTTLEDDTDKMSLVSSTTLDAESDETQDSRRALRSSRFSLSASDSALDSSPTCGFRPPAGLGQNLQSSRVVWTCARCQCSVSGCGCGAGSPHPSETRAQP